MHFEQDIKNAFGSESAGIIKFLPTLGSSLVAYIANHHCRLLYAMQEDFPHKAWDVGLHKCWRKDGVAATCELRSPLIYCSTATVTTTVH